MLSPKILRRLKEAETEITVNEANFSEKKIKNTQKEKSKLKISQNYTIPSDKIKMNFKF